jgi:hypothetical protein
MLLGNLHGRMAEKNGHVFHRYASQEQFHGERVPQSVGNAVAQSFLDSCGFEEFRNLDLIIADCGFLPAIATPEIKFVSDAWSFRIAA